MGFYSRFVLPALLDWAMEEKRLAPLRQSLLASASGTVLEIGFGAGANLPYYPSAVQKLIAIDPSEPLMKRAKKKLPSFQGEFVSVIGSAAKIALPRHSVDCVVSTFTLCSVPDTLGVLREVKRVLRPDGKLLFLEHGLAPERSIQRWQQRLNPWQKRLAGGCHLNRNIRGLLADACLDVGVCKSFYVEGVPKVLGFVSQGEAN